MSEYKNAYDALTRQYELMQDAAQRIEQRFEDGDIEGALELQPELDEAQMKADQIGSLYRKLVNIEDGSPQALFVPAAETIETDGTALSRAEFDRLPAAEKAKYIGEGGKISDEEA